MEPVEGDDASIWSPEFEHTFVQLLVDLVNNGRIVNGSVNINMWSSIADKMSELTGRTYTATQCWTKFLRLRMNHREFSDLLHHKTGFGWDPMSKTVQGTETQWQQYLRVTLTTHLPFFLSLFDSLGNRQPLIYFLFLCLS